MFVHNFRVPSTFSVGVVTLTLGCAGQTANQSPHQTPAPVAGSPAMAETHTPGATPVSRTGVQQRPVLVASFGAFAEWDDNGDGQVELHEFRKRLSQREDFTREDADKNGQLSELEFSTALYHAWDTDGDESIDVYEYRNGQGAWFIDGRWHAAFDDWDRDGNKELTLVELRGQASNLLAHWDTNRNGALDELEYNTGRYSAWDVNNDDIVDVYEFRRVAKQPSTGSSPDVGGERSSNNERGSVSPRHGGQVRGYGSFYDYDSDSDEKVTLEEFRQALARTSMFADWEAIKQADPQDEGVRRRLFQFWDLDGDEKLDMFEFRHGAGVFFPRVDTYGNFVAWDANQDHVLTQSEFVNYQGAPRLMKDWDKNESRTLESDEVSGLVYEAWDINGDGILEKAEWRWW